MIKPMTARVFLLRAVNVGGAKLPMAELREIAADLGATDVSTYIASGNLIATPPKDLDGFERGLEQAIENKYGFFREVISRTRAELQEALAALVRHWQRFELVGEVEMKPVVGFNGPARLPIRIEPR